MSIQPNKPSAPVNIFQASQQAIGVSVPDAMRWIGPFIASTWFFTAGRIDDSSAPSLSPLAWLEQTAVSFGWHIQWPMSMHVWLGHHQAMFWILLAVAAFAVGQDQGTGATSGITISLLALLLAMSIHGAWPAILVYATVTFGIAFLAYIADLAAAHADDEAYASVDWTFLRRWLLGPILVLFVMPFGPLILLAIAVQHYRTPRVDMSSRPFQLGLDADQLPTTPLSETPANVALKFLAESMLYASVSDDKNDTIASLRRRRATGAKVLPRAARARY